MNRPRECGGYSSVAQPGYIIDKLGFAGFFMFFCLFSILLVFLFFIIVPF